MGEFAELLCALMAERGISGRALAKQVPCHDSMICRYRKGTVTPSARAISKIDQVLNAGGRLSQAAENDRAALKRRAVLATGGGVLAGTMLNALGAGTGDRLSWVMRQPRRINQAAVSALGDVLAAQRRADDVLGCAVIVRPALAQLSAVEDLVRRSGGQVRPTLLDVAQQWARLAGGCAATSPTRMAPKRFMRGRWNGRPSWATGQ